MICIKSVIDRWCMVYASHYWLQTMSVMFPFMIILGNYLDFVFHGTFCCFLSCFMIVYYRSRTLQLPPLVFHVVTTVEWNMCLVCHICCHCSEESRDTRHSDNLNIIIDMYMCRHKPEFFLECKTLFTEDPHCFSQHHLQLPLFGSQHFPGFLQTQIFWGQRTEK